MARELNGAEQLPPHSPEMERGVLGCILGGNADSLNQCFEHLKTGADVFYDVRHQEIYRSVVMLSDSGEPIDELTIFKKLQERNLADKIGGIAYLNELHNSVPSAANVTYYIEALLEKWRLRRIVQICADVNLRAQQCDGQVDELITIVERDLLTINKTETTAILDGKMASQIMLDDLERRDKLAGKLSGLESGWKDLDRLTDGLQFGEQFVIGARPSQGKTAMGLNIFRHNAVTRSVPSLFVSLEMSVASVMKRLLSSQRDIPMEVIRRGSYTQSQIATMFSFGQQCAKAPMHIIDGISSLTIQQLCSRIRKYTIKHGIKLVVIDYMQKIKTSAKHEKKTYEVGDVSERLKALAVETGVAMVTLAQLNRDAVNQNGSQKEDKLPKLSNLADSGQIERDADCVGLIHRAGTDTKLIIAKQRDGAVGIVRLYFNGPFCRFENASNHEE